MYQVATPIWNQIASSQTLATEWAKTLFSMSPEQMEQEMERQGEALGKAGYPDKVVLAYQVAAPLLAENEAISRHIQQTESWGLRNALPEVTTPLEATKLMIQEYGLNQTQATQLLTLLQNLENRS